MDGTKALPRCTTVEAVMTRRFHQNRSVSMPQRVGWRAGSVEGLDVSLAGAAGIADLGGSS